MDTDEWFFHSIERYDKLHMFSICNSIYEQELKNENELYVAFKEEDRDEVTFITLPVKVMKKETVPPFVSPDLGFSANSVIITSLVQIKSIYKESKFIVSEHSGVSLYSCITSEFDNDQSIGKISDISGCKILQPRMAIDTTRNYLALSGKDDDKRLIVDLETSMPILQFKENNDGKVGILTPMFLSQNVTLFANTSTSRIEMYDVRIGDNSCTTLIIGNGANFERDHSAIEEPKWSYHTLFEDEINYKSIASFDTRIYAFSNEGHFRLYDSRNVTTAVCSVDKSLRYQPQMANRVRLKANPLNCDQFCVSGLDENLYVFNVVDGDTIRMIFKHDGHLFDESNPQQIVGPVLTTSFNWLPQVSDNTIVSSSTNSDVQCWQFIAQ